jgi:cell division protein FtsZ
MVLLPRAWAEALAPRCPGLGESQGGGALTVAVCHPVFEGKKRQQSAERGIQELKNGVDTLIAIPNQRLLLNAGKKTTLLDAFKKADEVLLHAVKGISDLITIPGLVNLDFNDVRTVMSEMGMAFMGIGRSSGENRAVEAAQAISVRSWKISALMAQRQLSILPPGRT